MLETNLDSVLIGSLCFQLSERVKIHLKINTKGRLLYFKAFPTTRIVDLASLELSGQLMQEIHHFDTPGMSLRPISAWYHLKSNVFLISKNTRNKSTQR